MKNVTFSKKYNQPIRFGLISAALLALIAATTQDMGEWLTTYINSLVAYGALILLILLRRPSSPTRQDLLIVKWGLLILFLAGLIIYPAVWKWRGVP